MRSGPKKFSTVSLPSRLLRPQPEVRRWRTGEDRHAGSPETHRLEDVRAELGALAVRTRQDHAEHRAVVVLHDLPVARGPEGLHSRVPASPLGKLPQLAVARTGDASAVEHGHAHGGMGIPVDVLFP
jgi:hypothetical protein